MAKLTDPVTILKGVGPTKAKQLAQLNILTLQDLICHFPRGYEDRTKLVTIDKLVPDQPACFKAMVMNTPRTAHVRKGLDLTRACRMVLKGSVSPPMPSRFSVMVRLAKGASQRLLGSFSSSFPGSRLPAARMVLPASVSSQQSTAAAPAEIST